MVASNPKMPPPQHKAPLAAFSQCERMAKVLLPRRRLWHPRAVCNWASNRSQRSFLFFEMRGYLTGVPIITGESYSLGVYIRGSLIVVNPHVVLSTQTLSPPCISPATWFPHCYCVQGLLRFLITFFSLMRISTWTSACDSKPQHLTCGKADNRNLSTEGKAK